MTLTIPTFVTSFLAIMSAAQAPLATPATKLPEIAAPTGYKLSAPITHADLDLRNSLIESRLPLTPDVALGDARVLLVGDRSARNDGRAWVVQSLPALKAAGVTHIGFESLKADQQSALDEYQGGRLSRADLLAALLGSTQGRKHDGVHQRSRLLAAEELVSAVDAVLFAGLKVVALGVHKEEEDAAFRLVADRVFNAVGAEGRMVALVKPRRLSRTSAAGWLAESGLTVRTFGLSFPEKKEMNRSLARLDDQIRFSDLWAYVPLDPLESGMDALLLPPAVLP